MNNSVTPTGLLDSIRNSQLLRVMLIVILILLLQIPISLINGVVIERETRRQAAIQDVTSIWGKQQSIVGPLLLVPYREQIEETDQKGIKKLRTEVQSCIFLPDDLKVSGNIQCEVRHRGIFKVPVYSTTLNFAGQFPHPDPSAWGIEAGDILWDQAHLTVRISDPRAITNQATLRWNDHELHFLPGAGEYDSLCTGIHVPLKNQLSGDTFNYSLQLSLNGSEGIFFVPLGKETTVEVESNWQDPSFQGNWLPLEHKIDASGFKARWSIPFLGRNYPQEWKRESKLDDAMFSSLFGVTFATAMDHYRMSERSVKYAILFLSMTFAALWLFQVLAKVRIHAIQYLLVGAGLCLFFLLELSLAEHIGFTVAYICATLAITALIFCYCIFVLHGFKRSMIMGCSLLLLYGYLYILLMNQDYALLVGSICLFFVLALIMFVTRKTDWYSVRN